MKSTEFHPVHYDAHGRLRLPLLFWLVLLLQARTWVLFVIAGASREQGTALLNLFYPDHDNFWLGRFISAQVKNKKTDTKTQSQPKSLFRTILNGYIR